MNKENHNKEEWGGWKILEDMLDHPDENGIYPTSKCYQELYEFVVAQKKAQKQTIEKEMFEEFLGSIAKEKATSFGLGYKEAEETILKKIAGMKLPIGYCDESRREDYNKVLEDIINII